MLPIDARGQHMHTPVHTCERRSRETACGVFLLTSFKTARYTTAKATAVQQQQQTRSTAMYVDDVLD